MKELRRPLFESPKNQLVLSGIEEKLRNFISFLVKSNRFYHFGERPQLCEMSEIVCDLHLNLEKNNEMNKTVSWFDHFDITWIILILNPQKGVIELSHF